MLGNALAAMAAQSKAAPATGSPPARESRQAIDKIKAARLFLPGGATITDGFVNAYYAINRHWQVQIFTQYERFLIPSYMSGSQHNTSGWLQITWNPELHLHR